MSPRVRPSSISEMTVGTVDAYEQGCGRGQYPEGISGRNIRTTDTVRSRVFVVRFY